MADLVYIANAALDRIGQSQILSLDDPTTSARKAKLHIGESIRQVLRGGRWKSATKQALPAQLSASPLFQWSFAYQLPDDFIRMVRVVAGTVADRVTPSPALPVFGDAYEVPDYAIHGKNLLANDSVIQINYVADLTFSGNDVNVTDAALTELFILQLALALCWPFQQSVTLRNSIMQEFQFKFRRALATDAQDTKDPLVNRLDDSEWIRERRFSTNA